MKRIYIDMDDTLCQYSKSLKERLEKIPTQPYPQSQYGFFIELEPIQDAVESIKELSKYYQIYFLTAPSWMNPMSYAEKCYWIQKHFGMEWSKQLILAWDKSLLIGDYLIDDKEDSHKQNEFTGKHLHYGSTMWPHWSYITKVMKSQTNLNPEFRD